MIVTDASFAATAVSPHLGRTPEGYLVALAVPVCRTAQRRATAQLYRASELDLPGNEMIPVYRLPQEVFSPKFLSSLEGKPLCQEHPSTFLDANNYQNYIRGLVTNPRRGEQLDNGEWPILCDLVIYDNVLAELVESGLMRECSVGYRCKYLSYRDGARQTELFANHVAVVMRGRAGDEIRIMDSQEAVMDVKLREQLSEAIQLAERVIEQKRGESRTMPGLTAYEIYDSAQQAGQKFSDEHKAAGQELGRQFLESVQRKS